MKDAFVELKKRGSYITEISIDEIFIETLKIKKEDVFITLNYQDGPLNKCIKLKLLLFQNERVFNNYGKWISVNQIDGIKITKRFHFFIQHNFIFNTFLVLLTPKTECNYFMGKNKILIIEKLNKIVRLWKRYKSQYLFY